MGIALDLRGNSNSQPGIVSEVARSAKPGRIGRIDTPSRAHFHPKSVQTGTQEASRCPMKRHSQRLSRVATISSPRLLRVIYER